MERHWLWQSATRVNCPLSVPVLCVRPRWKSGKTENQNGALMLKSSRIFSWKCAHWQRLPRDLPLGWAQAWCETDSSLAAGINKPNKQHTKDNIFLTKTNQGSISAPNKLIKVRVINVICISRTHTHTHLCTHLGCSVAGNIT